MNRVTQISNVFNVICQLLTDVQAYHFGTLEKINQGYIKNNFTNSATPVGDLFPKVLALPPDVEVNFDDSKGIYNWTLLFCDLQFYDNEGAIVSKSMSEIFRDLGIIQTNFFKALKQLQSQSAPLFQIIQPVRTEPSNFYGNNRLAVLRTDFSMSVMEDCNTQTINLNDLQAPFAWPVASWDYEDPDNQ